MVKTFRQGDVLLRSIPRIPKGTKKSDDRILVRGEATGHCHRADGAQLQVFRDGDRMYLKGKGQLVHEEHAPIPLEGAFEVLRQREYQPRSTRLVRD